MSHLEHLIKNIQAGHMEDLQPLLTRFNPLIINWLIKNKKLYSQEEEDYRSMAKIILVECALNFDVKKQVPFHSYYKIALWHATGNYRRKKQPVCISLDNWMDTKSVDDLVSNYEHKEEVEYLKTLTKHLTSKERVVIYWVQQGYKNEEIAKLLGVKKKTIQNRKYMAIKKLKEVAGKKR